MSWGLACIYEHPMEYDLEYICIFTTKMCLEFYIRLYFIAALIYQIVLNNEWIIQYKKRKIGSNGYRHYGPISSLIRFFNF